MKKILKTIYVGGSKATLECETQTEYYEYAPFGSNFSHKVVTSHRSIYSIVVDYDYNPVVFELGVFYDSHEPWRTPIFEVPPFMDGQLLSLLRGFHVDWCNGNSIEDRCEKAKLRLNYWIEDRVNFELDQMKSCYN